MVKIKICGLSRLCDIEAVNEEMPDYIGFVFAESRRKITPAQALELRKALRPGIMAVGVFVDETTEHILSLAHNGIIDAIQLHGSESEDYIINLKKLTDKPVIKAVAVQKKGDARRWATSAADYLLLDNKSGGSGRGFDWDLIDTMAMDKPYFLAGGLNADNIIEAIEKTKPFAVDVSSGVETDGLKDPAKIRDFIRRIRNG
jgi:phosphoribosylanthranilate isomerase